MPALVFGGGVTALAVARALHRAKIPAWVTDAEDPLLRRSRVARLLPGDPPPTQPAGLARWLAATGLDRAVLFPCSDAYVTAIAALDPVSAERFPCSNPPREALQQIMDKAALADTTSRLGIPHPQSVPLEATEDLDAIPTERFEHAFLKPRDSQRFMQRFGVKAFRISSRDEAKQHFERAREAGLEVLLQDYIPGPADRHYFLDGFRDRHGVVRSLFARRRLRMYPPLFGNSSLMKSVPVRDAAPAAEMLTMLLGRVGYRGIFSAEFKLDPRDDRFKLIEVNARAWWYLDFANRCGVDVTSMAYADALGRPVEGVTDYPIGKRCVYPYSDFFAAREAWRSGDLGLLAWARSWIGSVQPVFRWSDPLPALLGGMAVLAGKPRNAVRSRAEPRR